MRAIATISTGSLLFLVFLASLSQVDTRKVGIYELKTGNVSMIVTNWGATIMSLFLPDRSGSLDDVVLGYSDVASYTNDTTYFGALVGRVVNRIAGASFKLNGTVYHLYRNDGNNSLHGGHRGFSKVIWTVDGMKLTGESPFITFSYHSFDGEQGFPGALDTTVTYRLAGLPAAASGGHTLTVTMTAMPRGKFTLVNLAQHGYWNLAGVRGRCDTILNHTVQIFASEITAVDDHLIPTGVFAPVAGTVYDFRTPMPVGSRIKAVPGGGYDINYVIDSPPDREGGMRKMAVVEDSGSGRVMELWSDQPGVQFYTGNFLKGDPGKGGTLYPQHGALCLETQAFPDAPHHPNFPSIIYGPGQVYKHTMYYKFTVKK